MEKKEAALRASYFALWGSSGAVGVAGTVTIISLLFRSATSKQVAAELIATRLLVRISLRFRSCVVVNLERFSVCVCNHQLTC